MICYARTPNRTQTNTDHKPPIRDTERERVDTNVPINICQVSVSVLCAVCAFALITSAVPRPPFTAKAMAKTLPPLQRWPPDESKVCVCLRMCNIIYLINKLFIILTPVFCGNVARQNYYTTTALSFGMLPRALTRSRFASSPETGAANHAHDDDATVPTTQKTEKGPSVCVSDYVCCSCCFVVL